MYPEMWAGIALGILFQHSLIQARGLSLRLQTGYLIFSYNGNSEQGRGGTFLNSSIYFPQCKDSSKRDTIILLGYFLSVYVAKFIEGY